jgi:hypothetical protein
MGKLTDEIDALTRPVADNRSRLAFKTGEVLTAEQLNESFEALGLAITAQREAILRLAHEIDESRA